MTDNTTHPKIHVELKVLTQTCPVCDKPAIKVGTYNSTSPHAQSVAYTEEVAYDCGAKLSLKRALAPITEEQPLDDLYVDELTVQASCPDQGKALLQQITGDKA